MKIKITLLLLAFICTNAYAQKNYVTNVEFKQRTMNGEPTLEITYDITKAKDASVFEVKIEEAIVNGQKVKITNIEGDIGDYIKRGAKKKAYWKILYDIPYDEFTVDEVIVLAYPVGLPPSVDCPCNQLPIGAGVLSIAGSGLGIVVWGLTQESQASADYDDYVNDRDPNSSFYTENGITRDELYDQANKKHKTAQVIMSVGGAVILASGGMLAKRFIDKARCKRENNCASNFELSPYVVMNNNYQNGFTSNSFGLTLKRKF